MPTEIKQDDWIRQKYEAEAVFAASAFLHINEYTLQKMLQFLIEISDIWRKREEILQTMTEFVRFF